MKKLLLLSLAAGAAYLIKNRDRVGGVIKAIKDKASEEFNNRGEKLGSEKTTATRA